MDERDLQRLIDKLRTLPPQRLAELETLVDFMRAGGEDARDRAAERLGKSMTKLAKLGLPPMSEDEVQAEIQAARRERRNRSLR